jgi:hypothetical protein
MELARICRRAHTGLEGAAILSRSRRRDRWFESTFLQRGVKDEPIETAVRRIGEYCSDRGALRSAARPAGLAQWANSRQFGR